MATTQPVQNIPDDEIIIDVAALENFGKILWDLRTSLDIKQTEVAKRMDVKQCHVSSIENRDVLKIPKLPTLVLYLLSMDYELVMRPKA